MAESTLYPDRGGGRIRPVSNPTYRTIFALPDGTDLVLQSRLDDEDAKKVPGGGAGAGIYSTGYTVTSDLRQNWGTIITPDMLDQRAADTMFYVLPEGYTDDVNADDSVLSPEQISAELLVQFKDAIVASARGERKALDVFSDLITEAVRVARKGFVRKPF